MAENVRVSARSNHGCWTCRLRKKKCDESRPVCLACISLELECHGYRSRPEWMDNGILQRDQASKVRRVVSQTRSRKGRRQQLPISQPPQAIGDGIRLSSTPNVSPPRAFSPIPVDEHLGAFSQDEYYHQASATDFGCFIDPAWSLWPSNDVSAMETLFDPESYYITPTTPHTTPHNEYPVQYSIPGSSEGILVSAADMPLLHEASETSSGIMPGEDFQSRNEEKARSTLNEWQGSASLYDRYCPKEAITYDLVGSSSQVSTMSEGREDTLFMYYLDQVFHVQYPFYHSQNRQGRGWLFSILRRVKSAYHAALALSERHLLSTASRNNDVTTSLVQLRTQNGHYDLAIQETQIMVNGAYTSNGYAPLVPSLEILTSLLQLLFCELFSGGRQNWQTHLRTACSFVPALLQARMPLTMLDSTSSDCRSEQPEDVVMHPEGDCAIDVLLGSFISFDIISSASTRSTPFLNINHLQVLDTLQFPLESLIGCRSSVIALLLEISLLDKWKKDAQSAHRLSIVDLAKRGSQIQQRLRQELAAIEDTASAGPSLCDLPGIIRTPTHSEISKIFALSAVTYLHVVVSGAYPELPEIAESVSETIIALKSLKDPRLLRSVVWPFCITGCLAVEEQYNFFRDLVYRADITQWTTGTCFEAFQIMEECWQARITSSETCDWVAAMKRRGCYVLLG